MKTAIRFFMAALLLGLCSLGYSQDVKVNINNQDATTKDDCPYHINGICVTEDIGGVNVDFITENITAYMVLTNYNSFPVNVLWQIEHTSGGIKTGNVVIGATGEKKIPLNGSSSSWNLNGLIVRKLAQ